jgi:hypothetical protein
MYGVEIFTSFVRGKLTMPRRMLAWISTSLSAAPSRRKKASSSRTPAGIDQPRRDRRVEGKIEMARLFVRR